MATLRTLRILPDADRVEQALLEASRSAPFVDGRGFCSFAELVEACEPARFLGRAPLSPLAYRLLLADEARALPPGPFGGFVRSPAFARGAAALFEHLTTQWSLPAELRTAAQRLGGARAERLGTLAALWEAVAARLAREALVTPAGLRRAAVERLEAGLPARLVPFQVFRFEALHDWPLLHVKLAQALARAAGPERTVVVALPLVGQPELGAVVAEAYAAFERDAVPGLELEPQEAPEHLAPLLAFGQGTSQPMAAPWLSHLSAATPRDELRALAVEARRRVDQGCPPEQVAIVFRDLAEEAERLTAALRAVGLRARVRLGAPLKDTAPGRLAIALVRFADEGFPAEALPSWLESRLVQLGVERPAELSRWLEEAGVRDDRLGARDDQGAYATRLGALEQRLERSAEARGGSTVRAEQVRRVREACAAFFAVARLPEEETLAAHAAAWATAVQRLGLHAGAGAPAAEAVAGAVGAEAVELAVAREHAALQALDGFRETLLAAVGQGKVGAHRLSRAEFARWLEDAAGDVNLPPSGPRAGAVRVLDARAVPGRQFAHVLVGGLVEGRFPARTPALPLLAPGDGEALNAAAKRRLVRLVAGEATQALPARLAEDRFLFFGALSAATRGVVLSWARTDDEGREQVPSTLLDETLRLLEPGATLRAPRAASPPLESAASLDELRARLALEWLSPPRTRLSRRAPGAELPSEALDALPWFADARRVAAMELERLDYFAHPDTPPGPYSGRLREPRTEAKLAALLDFDERRPLSAGMLETFATCAFQGLGKSVLRLEEREAPGEALDPRGSGSFSHAVLERLIPALAAQGWPAERVDLEPAIEAAVAEAAADFERSNFTGHPLLWPVEQTKARTMARRVLTQGDEAQPFAEHGLRFSLGEVAFGREAQGPWASVPLPGAFPGEATVHFTGRIDRVDQGPSGLGVIDYKAKRASGLPGRGDLFKPAFQLPVYLHAARHALGAPAVDAAWLSLRDAVSKPLSRLLDAPMSQLLAVDAEGRARAGAVNLANAVHGLLGRLREGDFGARSLDCEYCRFAQVCRIREQALDDWRPK